MGLISFLKQKWTEKELKVLNSLPKAVNKPPDYCPNCASLQDKLYNIDPIPAGKHTCSRCGEEFVKHNINTNEIHDKIYRCIYNLRVLAEDKGAYKAKIKELQFKLDEVKKEIKSLSKTRIKLEGGLKCQCQKN